MTSYSLIQFFLGVIQYGSIRTKNIPTSRYRYTHIDLQELNLDIILWTTLHGDIGLRPLIDFPLSHLGIKTIFVEFMSYSINPKASQ